MILRQMYRLVALNTKFLEAYVIYIPQKWNRGSPRVQTLSLNQKKCKEGGGPKVYIFRKKLKF